MPTLRESAIGSLLLLFNTAQCGEERVLVTYDEARPSQLELLRIVSLEDKAITENGLVRIPGKTCTYLIDRELWEPATWRLAKSVGATLESIGAQDEYSIGQLGDEASEVMLKRLNALSTPSGAPLFSKDTSFFVEAVANVSLGKGEATFVVRERARSNGHIADRKIPSKSPIYARPDLKNSICINASQDSTDAAHWKRLASTWVVLLERRKQIEEDLTDLERKLISHFKLGIAGADRLWPSKQIQQLPESVASQIQQQSFRKGWSIEQTKGAKVASVKSTLLVVFTFGKNEIAFPLRSLFDR